MELDRAPHAHRLLERDVDRRDAASGDRRAAEALARRSADDAATARRGWARARHAREPRAAWPYRLDSMTPDDEPGGRVFQSSGVSAGAAQDLEPHRPAGLST